MNKQIKSLEDINAEFEERGESRDTSGKGKKAKNKKEKNKNEKGRDNNDKSKKASIISDVIFYMTLIILVVLAFVFSGGDGSSRQLGGYRLFEVLSSSMESVYPRGSIVLVKETLSGELVVGDDITFLREDNSVITHRIIKIEEDYENSEQRGFATQGVDNAAPDDEVVLAQNVVGRVVRGFPRVGTVLSWIGDNLWLALFVFLSLMSLLFFIKLFWREQKRIKNRD